MKSDGLKSQLDNYITRVVLAHQFREHDDRASSLDFLFRPSATTSRESIIHFEFTDYEVG